MGSSSRGKSVLIISGDAKYREVIQGTLRRSGMNVAEAATGQEGLDLYNSPDHTFDLVLSSLTMPGISGGDIARYNFNNKKLPLVVCSAFSDSKFGLKLFDYGVYRYIVKPVDAEIFPQVIKNAIASNYLEADYDGGKDDGRNMSRLTIDTKFSDLIRINNWIASKIGDNLSSNERRSFLNYAGEFLLNAHEHGNLGIGEELKGKLLTNETFDIEVGLRESSCGKKITASICSLNGEVALSIMDEGNGFDHEKYTQMTEVDIASRIEMLNGRGIFMGRNFFNSVEYFNGGTKVVLIKRTGISYGSGLGKSLTD